MLITVQKVVTETVSLKLPAYFKDNYWHYCVNNDESVLQVSCSQITAWRAKSTGATDAANQAAKGEPISAEEFEKAYNETQATITLCFESNLVTQ